MDIQWIAGNNYVDFFSSEPFFINKCTNTMVETRKTSLQAFPICSKPVDSLTDKYRATLWALDSGCLFYVVVAPVVVGSEVDENNLAPTASSAGKEHEGALLSKPLESISLVVETRRHKGLLCPFAAIAILDTQTIFRDDFTDCMLAQVHDFMLIERVREPSISLFHRLFYHGLFAIPTNQEGLTAYVLPNLYTDRFCIDFQQENISWRHNRKLLHVISSNCFAVAINRDIRDSLRIAREYHSARVGATWLENEYIDLIVDMAKFPQFGVQIMAIELLERGTGKVLAGCLGYSLGSVYHDFTMFTVQRSRESFGTVITKVLGEALHTCGYNMWYWGKTLEYMTQFSTRYGARSFSREEFCARWSKFREKRPSCTLEEFFQSGRGMLQCLSLLS